MRQVKVAVGVADQHTQENNPMAYKITFLLRTHGDHHEHRAIECTPARLQATLTRLSKDRNVRDIWWEKTGHGDPKR